MAFVNEYISEDDVKKYDLDTLDRMSEGYKRYWTINRNSDIWLISLGTGKENDGTRWLFYWQSHVYRLTTESDGYYKKEQLDYYARRKITALYTGDWKLVPNLDRAAFTRALQAALEIFKGACVDNTAEQNAMTYHIELTWGI